MIKLILTMVDDPSEPQEFEGENIYSAMKNCLDTLLASVDDDDQDGQCITLSRVMPVLGELAEKYLENETLEAEYRCMSGQGFKITMIDDPCRYCGGNCPNNEDNCCDGYSGDVDNLYSE